MVSLLDLKLNTAGNVMKSIPVPLEEEEQAAFFRWVDFMVSTSMPALGTMFAIPNGGLRNKVVAAKLKAQGVRPGVCDIFWPLARGGYYGLFIEMKRRRGKGVTKKQQEFINAVRAQGYRAVVARGSQDAQDCVLGYYRMTT
jgi:hypothetical protein